MLMLTIWTVSRPVFFNQWSGGHRCPLRQFQVVPRLYDGRVGNQMDP